MSARRKLSNNLEREGFFVLNFYFQGIVSDRFSGVPPDIHTIYEKTDSKKRHIMIFLNVFSLNYYMEKGIWSQ